MNGMRIFVRKMELNSTVMETSSKSYACAHGMVKGENFTCVILYW